MADSSSVLLQGWLLKCVTDKQPWQSRWKKLWFVLRKKGHVPGQFFLQSYANDKCIKVKESIDLNLLEQVDRGIVLKFCSSHQFNKHIFGLKTKTKDFYFATSCADDMDKWVELILSLCPWKRRSPGYNCALATGSVHCRRLSDCNCPYPCQKHSSTYLVRHDSGSIDSGLFHDKNYISSTQPYHEPLRNDLVPGLRSRAVFPIDQRKNSSTSSCESFSRSSYIPISECHSGDFTPPVIDRNLKPRKKSNTDSGYCEVLTLDSVEKPAIEFAQTSPSNVAPSTSLMSTVYKTIDFVKTQALTKLRHSPH